jgi:hypothetical protein
VPEARNLGTAKQACAVAGVKSAATLRKWVNQGFIRAERVGNGRYKYDLDDIANMRRVYPRREEIDERIAELICGAPEFTDEQIAKIRLVLTAGGGALSPAKPAKPAKRARVNGRVNA